MKWVIVSVLLLVVGCGSDVDFMTHDEKVVHYLKWASHGACLSAMFLFIQTQQTLINERAARKYVDEILSRLDDISARLDN